MTAAGKIDMARARPAKAGDLLLGEDWETAEASLDPAITEGRARRSLISLNRSPLARKIIVFNLLALIVLVSGVLFLNPFRDSLVVQREKALVTEAQLVANVVSASQAAGGALPRSVGDIAVGPGLEVFLFDPSGALIAQGRGKARPGQTQEKPRSTVITDFLNTIWSGVSGVVGGSNTVSPPVSGTALAGDLFAKAVLGETAVATGRGAGGGVIFSVATPVVQNGTLLGVVALASAEGEIDRLVRYEREQILQMFVIALLVSIGLSLVLASTIANPLSDLAAAAELGRDRDSRKLSPGRIRIPDLAARPDEIGRLSIAMRGMVAALYDRIEANEQFAADVSHEIKNPLASLRSAVGSLRMVKKEEHREKLLDVIDHDVRRLDRLVSDISNASRLDSELVKEEEEEFNLVITLTNLAEFLGQQAGEKGVEFITDFPADPILIRGLEGRLAQVFVNLISNAISFCEDGDAVRVWARRRENRVLIVVEDTGPGIPEQALAKVFKRFYSDRPATHFGNNSGLGLSISKQIVEAHGGVIWAENIRPTNADPTSDPLGARFVVGLPI
ncbi:sensor histidine kinase [Tabrizicola oligotrophica]|uniref:histidine kinase n=1 Tax=Tabrizicola oligotrophica TaxID=2710650 RepID=A0A6M0QX33_9RHOB|nr:sensor histidine kinase [Tabrizicola oligotrophica]NEY91062.1 histidine kinase [Tabrizicola oligotrophica]